MHLLETLVTIAILHPVWSQNSESFCINDVAKECRCVRGDGSVMDLKSVASKNASAPRFVMRNEDVEPAELIQYNPCFGFRCGEGEELADSAVCDTNEEGQVRHKAFPNLLN